MTSAYVVAVVPAYGPLFAANFDGKKLAWGAWCLISNADPVRSDVATSPEFC